MVCSPVSNMHFAFDPVEALIGAPEDRNPCFGGCERDLGLPLDCFKGQLMRPRCRQYERQMNDGFHLRSVGSLHYCA